MEEEEWNKFLNWLENYLEKSGYVLKQESLMRLRNSWYGYLSQSGLNKFKSFSWGLFFACAFITSAKAKGETNMAIVASLRFIRVHLSR